MSSGCMLTVYRFFWSYHVRLIRQPSQPTKQAVQFYWEIISHFNFFPQRKIKLPLKVKNEILHPKFLRGELSSKYFTATAMHRACSSLWFTHQKYWWCSHSNQGQHTTNAAVYFNFPSPLSPEIIGGKNLIAAKVPHQTYLLPAGHCQWQTLLFQWSLRGEGVQWPFLW